MRIAQTLEISLKNTSAKNAGNNTIKLLSFFSITLTTLTSHYTKNTNCNTNSKTPNPPISLSHTNQPSLDDETVTFNCSCRFINLNLINHFIIDSFAHFIDIDHPFRQDLITHFLIIYSILRILHPFPCQTPNYVH